MGGLQEGVQLEVLFQLVPRPEEEWIFGPDSGEQISDGVWSRLHRAVELCSTVGSKWGGEMQEVPRWPRPSNWGHGMTIPYPYCWRQTTLRMDSPTESARQQRVRSPDQGFFPGRRHSDAQVSGAWKRVGPQIKNGAMARERERERGREPSLRRRFRYPFVDPFL